MSTPPRRHPLHAPWVRIERFVDGLARAVGSWAEASARGMQERLDALDVRDGGVHESAARGGSGSDARDRTTRRQAPS